MTDERSDALSYEARKIVLESQLSTRFGIIGIDWLNVMECVEEAFGGFVVGAAERRSWEEERRQLQERNTELEQWLIGSRAFDGPCASTLEARKERDAARVLADQLAEPVGRMLRSLSPRKYRDAHEDAKKAFAAWEARKWK